MLINTSKVLEQQQIRYLIRILVEYTSHRRKKLKEFNWKSAAWKLPLGFQSTIKDLTRCIH